MITKKSVRISSKSARWSIRCAVFALTLLVVSVLLHRFGQLETTPFFGVLALVAMLAGLGAVLSVTGLIGLWSHGYAGGRRSAAALTLCLLILSPFGFALWKAASLPRIADISTDLADPPQFAGDAASGLRQDLQSTAYPDVTGRRYSIPGENLLALVERQLAAFGWRVMERRGSFSGNGETLLEAEAKTLVMGFKDRIIVRVTDEGGTTYVDMRSKSGFGDHDMGANAARIVKFMQGLDALATLTPAAQTAK